MRLAGAAVLVALALGGAACGGDSQAEARDLYRAYRAAHEERIVHERDLRSAIADLAAAAGERDRATALAAIGRGEDAVREIDRLFERELDAAAKLTTFSTYERDASRLERGLRTSREGLALAARELAIGRADPFLERRRNRVEVNRLARAERDLIVEGELERRRADRALAVALGLEPHFDPLFDVITGPTTTGS
jgi:hypothetical protein